MGTQAAGPRYQGRFAAQWAILALALLGLGGLIVFYLVSDHTRVREREQARLHTQAGVINDILSLRLQETDKLLAVLRARYVSLPDTERSKKEANDRLEQLVQVISGVSGLAVLNGDGRVVFASQPDLVGRDFSDRKVFRLARAQADRLYLSAPSTSSTGAWGMALGRSVAGPNGEFWGVVVALLDPADFRALLSSVRYADDMRTSIYHGEGSLFVSEPDPGPAGSSLSFRPPLFARHMSSGQAETSYSGPTDLSDESRVMVMRTLDRESVSTDVQLVIAVSRSEDAIFQQWRRDALLHAAIFSFFALALVLALFAFQRLRHRGARDIQIADERLSLAQTGAGIGVFEISLVTDEVTWTPELEAMFGLQPGAFGGRAADWYALMHPDDVPMVQDYFKQHRNSPEPFAFEFRGRHSSGLTRWFAHRGRVQFGPQGRPVSAVGVVVDITESKRMERELRESRERFASVFDYCPIGITVTRVEDGRILEFNDAALRMYGYTREQVIGRTVPELRMYADSAVRLVVQERLRREGRIDGFEMQFRRSNGDIGTLVMSGRIVEIAGDQVFIVTVADITERRLSDQRLRRTTEELDSYFNNTLVMFSIHDAGGYLRKLNPMWEKVLGHKLSDLEGRRFPELVHPEDVQATRVRLDELAAGGGVGLFLNRYRHKDGSYRWLEWSSVRVEDRIYAAAHDVTDRVRAERELRAAREGLELRVVERTAQLHHLAVQATLAEERERQAIARDLHDELGQVLHVIRIKLDTLAKRSPATEANFMGELTGLISQASGQVRSLTSQLSPPVLRDLGLVPALRWLSEEMERLYDLDVEIDAYGAGDSLTTAQSFILFRAVRELLINVSKHARVGSAVVTLRVEGEQLAVTVGDMGIGIADVGAALSAKQGFGFASVRERIGFLGGSMNIVARLGEGTTVIITMPLERATPAGAVA